MTIGGAFMSVVSASLHSPPTARSQIVALGVVVGTICNVALLTCVEAGRNEIRLNFTSPSRVAVVTICLFLSAALLGRVAALPNPGVVGREHDGGRLHRGAGSKRENDRQCCADRWWPSTRRSRACAAPFAISRAAAQLPERFVQLTDLAVTDSEVHER